MRKQWIFLGILVFALAILVGGFLNRANIKDAVFAYQKSSLPEAQPFTEFVTPAAPSGSEPRSDKSERETTQEENSTPAQEESSPQVREEESPSQINLAVPFTPQAPHANWDLPYQEACEEASILMVARYKNSEPIRSPEDADQEILKLVEFQNSFFGDYKDTTAEETAEIARVYYGFTNTEVVYDFTVEDIKREVANGNPVILPAAGRQLPNPYFRTPGPLYHMLVVRGYTEDTFITNDPGTWRGEEFIYTYSGLLEAVHDWNGGDVEHGRRVMIVVK